MGRAVQVGEGSIVAVSVAGIGVGVGLDDGVSVAGRGEELEQAESSRNADMNAYKVLDVMVSNDNGFLCYNPAPWRQKRHTSCLGRASSVLERVINPR